MEGANIGSGNWRSYINSLMSSDREMLSRLCRKMINHLAWNGNKEAMDILHSFSGSNSAAAAGCDASDDPNIPMQKKSPESINFACSKAFEIASSHMRNDEISSYLKKWIRQEKAYYLIKDIDRIDVPINGIIDSLKRFRSTSKTHELADTPTESWIMSALLRRFFSDKPDFIRIGRQYSDISDFYDISNRIVYQEGSHGRLGGKSAGLFLAYRILDRESKKIKELDNIKVPKTWYITSDTLTEFQHFNNLEELNEQKYKDISRVRMEYPNIIQLMKNSRFPPDTIASLSKVLDDFGDTPLIVRSSSLLEDQIGASFSGKYKSLFLANCGEKRERLEALMDAIIEIYASVFSPDSIQYRAERGLLDYPEEMGIMIQEVVGRRVGRYYFPLLAGVAFSNNEFRWSPRIRREDGLIRFVPGLGTRAVDRLSDDFPILVSPGQPGLRVNVSPDEIRRYSPRKADVINLETNSFETVNISDVLKEYGSRIPDIHEIVSAYHRDHIEMPLAVNIDFKKEEYIVTFDGIISRTNLVRKIDVILKTLKEKLGTPVDIEFAISGKDFYLLQCRPLNLSRESAPSPIPRDIDPSKIVFTANKHISNGRIPDISYIVYVDPEGYDRLRERSELLEVGRVVGQLNLLLPKRKFILMGPGRWGSRGDIKLGIQIGYVDINNTAALIEIARRKSGFEPELSFGTHFFQDLVEANIRYIPIYPDDKGVIFNSTFLTRSENILKELLPKYAHFSDLIHVIFVPGSSDGSILKILLNGELGEALAYLTLPSSTDEDGDMRSAGNADVQSDDFWRWRHYMAEKIAERMDLEHFGVEAIYLFGSTNQAAAGPGSDIDLLIHFRGNSTQKTELENWLQGWSLSLAEENFLKTGYTSKGLLDVHFITDEDIAAKNCFAVKIGAVTDPAYLLKSRNG